MQDMNESEGIEQESEVDKELVSFVVEHCDRWRDYRDANYMDNWNEYEQIGRAHV